MRSFLKEYSKPLAIFLFSRLIILLVFYFLTNYQFGIPQFSQWDARSYLTIAKEGYQVGEGYKNEGSYIAFFPLFPIAVKVISEITFQDVLFSALALNLVLGLASSILMFKIAKKRWNEEIAIKTVLLFSFFPTSVFLSVPYTECLFLFLVLLTFVFLEKKEFEMSSFTIALAMVTRITGFLLIPLLVYYLYKEKEKIVYWPIYLLTAFAPFLTFLYYQKVNFNTPFAFLEAQKANWYHTLTFPWIGFRNLVQSALSKGDIALMWKADFVMLITMVSTLLLSRKAVDKFFLFFGAGVILLTLSQSFILGTSRYMILVLPFYFFWAKYLNNRPIVFQLLLLVSACWMTFNSGLFFLSKSIF